MGLAFPAYVHACVLCMLYAPIMLLNKRMALHTRKCLRTAPEAGALVRFSALRRSGDMRTVALWLLASLCCCCLLQPASCSIRGWLKGVAEGALNRGKAIGE